MNKLFFAGLAMAWTVVAGAAPQDGAVFGDWKTACEQGEQASNCHIFQHIKVKESDKTLLHLAVGHAKESDLPVALFNLPLGVALPPGVQFKVGEQGEPQNMPYSICTQQGCRAVLKLEDGLLSAMREASSGTLTFVGPDAKAYNIPISFRGFAKGFDSLAP